MARDDVLDNELSQLEREIEAKVDSLFVEIEEGGDAGPVAEDDPWKDLKEHFLTLEWEIDSAVLEKIAREVEKLSDRFPDGAVGTLLGWLGQVAERIRGQGKDIDQESMKVLHQLKDGLLRLVADPFLEPGPILTPLRGKVERLLLGEEEEAPTITLEAVKGEEELLFEDLDRTVEEALGPEEEPIFGEEAVAERPTRPEDETLIAEAVDLGERWEPLQEPEKLVVTEETPPLQEALHVEMSPPGVAAVAPPPLVHEEEEIGDLERLRNALTESGRRFRETLDRLKGGGDPLGLAAVFQEVTQRVREFSQGFEALIDSLEVRLQALEALDLAPRQPEPVPDVAPEPLGAREEVLFVSVSNRVFGIPLASVMGVFRVPSKAVSQVVQMAEVFVKGRNVPLISLWKKLGLGRSLYTFPKEEKRVLLVKSGIGEVGLLVDQVLARQEVLPKPLEGEERGLFRGMVTVEKNAFVVDIETL